MGKIIGPSGNSPAKPTKLLFTNTNQNTNAFTTEAIPVTTKLPVKRIGIISDEEEENEKQQEVISAYNIPVPIASKTTGKKRKTAGSIKSGRSKKNLAVKNEGQEKEPRNNKSRAGSRIKTLDVRVER
jgi:hypothetical protein